MDIQNLSFDCLKAAYDKMMNDYDFYKETLDREKTFRQVSYRTTQMIVESIRDEIQ